MADRNPGGRNDVNVDSGAGNGEFYNDAPIPTNGGTRSTPPPSIPSPQPSSLTLPASLQTAYVAANSGDGGGSAYEEFVVMPSSQHQFLNSSSSSYSKNLHNTSGTVQRSDGASNIRLYSEGAVIGGDEGYNSQTPIPPSHQRQHQFDGNVHQYHYNNENRRRNNNSIINNNSFSNSSNNNNNNIRRGMERSMRDPTFSIREILFMSVIMTMLSNAFFSSNYYHKIDLSITSNDISHHTYNLIHTNINRTANALRKFATVTENFQYGNDDDNNNEDTRYRNKEKAEENSDERSGSRNDASSTTINTESTTTKIATTTHRMSSTKSNNEKNDNNDNNNKNLDVPQQNGAGECDEVNQIKIAIMISGQFGRFLYKDNKGPLIANLDDTVTSCDGKTQIKKYLVDLYVALHRGKQIARPFYRNLIEPPYIKSKAFEWNTAKIADEIGKYYMTSRGANNVYIKFENDVTISKTDLFFGAVSSQNNGNEGESLLDEIKSHNNDASRPHEKKKKKNLLDFVRPEHQKRFHQNTRMLYMRHLAFKMSTEKGKVYDAYISQREDTYFYNPMDMERMGYDFSYTVKPYVFVESDCKMEEYNYYSDKIHIGNRSMMQTLFGSTWNDFVQRTISRIEYGVKTANERDGMHTYWVNAFLHYLLDSSDADVHEVNVYENLNRVDGRYSIDRLCVPRLYYECLSGRTKKTLMTSKNNNANQKVGLCYHDARRKHMMVN